MKDKVWKKKAKVYFISLTCPDLTRAEIGKKVGYTSHDKLSKAIRSVRGELSRIGGEEYEKSKTAELVARGFEAQRL